MQGMTGMWGGVQGSLMAASGSTDGNGSYYGGQGFIQDSLEQYYFNIGSGGNASNFGDCTTPHTDGASTSGGTSYGASSRGIMAGGDGPIDTIDYVATTGSNASDFGELTAARSAPAACSNGIRGCIGGGNIGGSQANIIDYITIETTGNALDFGDLTQARSGIDSISGGVRGVWARGQDPHFDVIDYVTIGTTGNASDFGECTQAVTFGCGTNSDPGSGQLRGVFMAGHSGVDNHVEYITIDTAGNAQDWGELNSNHAYRCGGGTNGPRGFCGGGNSATEEITYITIGSLGTSGSIGELPTTCASATGWSGSPS